MGLGVRVPSPVAVGNGQAVYSCTVLSSVSFSDEAAVPRLRDGKRGDSRCVHVKLKRGVSVRPEYSIHNHKKIVHLV